MRIITISREYGSGGRELGKLMAESLGYTFFDREIIENIALEQGENPRAVMQQSIKGGLLAQEKQILENIAKSGKDCVIVGRNADVFLSDYKPFSIFVCADLWTRIKWCREHHGEDASPEEFEKKIRQIDRSRSEERKAVTQKDWGDHASYNLTVNTSGWKLEELAPVVADYAIKWFER